MLRRILLIAFFVPAQVRDSKSEPFHHRDVVKVQSHIIDCETDLIDTV